jgi:hypothetical protein
LTVCFAAPLLELELDALFDPPPQPARRRARAAAATAALPVVVLFTRFLPSGRVRGDVRVDYLTLNDRYLPSMVP